ncbi:MAG TPA: hypothetical protein VFC10_07440 [Terriglobia bacterium]|jgi:hypothetical protein|nr:hypothetical protein [Terracidiphilus sp.]HZT69567.1 hypothetical protein [Terriglobia bacterium]
MGYCTVDDVAAEFPSFVRNADIQDAQIQAWIDRAAAAIAAALVQRGFDPDAPPLPLTTRQSALLSGLNAAAVVRQLGDVLASRVSLQTGEPAVAGARGQALTTILKDIRAGAYDQFFGIQSRFRDSNAFAGADTDGTTPEDRQENRAFGMNQDL